MIETRRLSKQFYHKSNIPIAHIVFASTTKIGKNVNFASLLKILVIFIQTILSFVLSREISKIAYTQQTAGRTFTI